MNAPIVIFAYRRPEHLRNTVTSLMQCQGFEHSPVIVYGDGPKNEQEYDDVEATRAVAQSLLGERAEYYFSETNRGLSTSVINGVSDVLKRFDRVIVIEDDLELSRGFLSYMNRALDVYANDEKVFQVSGYMFDAPEINSSTDALFLPFTISWGWATWRRAWHAFEADAPGWRNLVRDKKLRYHFNIDGTYGFSSMLVRQMLGFRDSWAVRWCWSVFNRKGLTLYPPASMVKNTGFDGSGTHGRGILRSFTVETTEKIGASINFPLRTAIDAKLYQCVKDALWRQNGRWLGRVADTIRWWKTVRALKAKDQSGRPTL
jgi:hypothetical protein